MSVQNGWKEYYKMFVVALHNKQLDYAAELRDDMFSYRLTAALERKLETAEVRSAVLKTKLDEAQLELQQIRDLLYNGTVDDPASLQPPNEAAKRK